MNKSCLLIVLFAICGCSNKTGPTDTDQSPQQEPQRYRITMTVESLQCPALVKGVKYIPDANDYADYSDDFESWHYHGRNRAPYDWEREIKAVEIAANQNPDVAEWQSMLVSLKIKYADKIAEASIQDEKRYQEQIATMIREANGKFEPVTAGK